MKGFCNPAPQCNSSWSCLRRLKRPRLQCDSPKHFMTSGALWGFWGDNEVRSESPERVMAAPSSPPRGSPRRTPRDSIILRSDSQTYLNAEQRKPKALQSAASTGDSPRLQPSRKRSSSFSDQLEAVEIARRNSMKDLIPNCEDELVVQLTAELGKLGLSGKWRIPLAQRKTLERELDISTDMLMKKLTIIAQHLSKPSISAFHVGSAGLGASGDVYLGANVEVSSGDHASNVCGFHYCIHGEQSVVLNMFENGEQALLSIYISHLPCGMCRQFLAELPDYRSIKVWTPQLDATKELGELLPHSFGPQDLGMSSTMIPWGEPNPVRLAESSEAKQVDPDLASEAERAAQRAHAPYTSSFAGAVIRLKSGQLCRGSCVESVAFNPSVSPMQMALLSLWWHGGQVQDIAGACLAEDPSSPITYKGSDAALLAAVAPWASLWLMPLQSTSAD